MPIIIKKIAIGIFIAFVFSLGVALFFQQKAINQMKLQILAVENASAGKKADSAAANSAAPRVSQEDIESQKAFSGEIKSAATDNLDVEAELSKLKDSAKLQSDSQKGVTLDDFDKFKKMIKVSLNDKTQYSGLKKEDLKAGDKIVIIADNSPFKADNLTALKVAPLKGQ